MSYEINIKRKLDILDKKIQKNFNIKNIKVYKEEAIPSIYMDEKEGNLYSFSMNGIEFIEYIKKEVTSNGNYSIYEITYAEKNRFLDNQAFYLEYPIEYIESGYECPKCNKWHTIEEHGKVTCLECGYSNIINLFEINKD